MVDLPPLKFLNLKVIEPANWKLFYPFAQNLGLPARKFKTIPQVCVKTLSRETYVPRNMEGKVTILKTADTASKNSYFKKNEKNYNSLK